VNNIRSRSSGVLGFLGLTGGQIHIHADDHWIHPPTDGKVSVGGFDMTENPIPANS
jgi:hypothetical protein